MAFGESESLTCDTMRRRTPKSEKDDLDEYSSDKIRECNAKLLTVGEIPNHLAFNPNIRRGYRGALTLQQCIARYLYLQ